MKILPPLRGYSTKQWLLVMSGLFIGVLAWQFHYILEYAVIINNNLSPPYIIFHYIGVIVGLILGIKIVYKLNHFVVFSISISFLLFFFTCLLIFNQPWFVPYGFLGAGINVGILLGLLFFQISFFFKDRKFGARKFSLAMTIVMIILIIEGFLNIILNPWLGVIFLLVNQLLSLISLLIGKVAHDPPAQKPFKVSQYLRDKDNLPSIAFMFFWGLFFTNTHYASYLILERNGFQLSYNTFCIILFITMVVLSFPNGIISDIIGRRITVLIGIIIQSLAFMIVSFLDQNELILIYIFPMILGIGFSMSIQNSIVVLIELPEPQHIRDHTALLYIFAVTGMIFGLILTELLKPIFLIEPSYLTMGLLFIFVCAIFVISQMKETLPSKAMLELKRPMEKISEEDLLLYKEQKICLVCKGKISGFTLTFICPECDAQYCEKCAKYISEAENLCWVCDNPIDTSKAVKHSVKMEDDDKKEIEIHK